MNPNDTIATGLANVCKVCRTRIAEKAVPFYCAKSSEMRPGIVPIYAFSTPVCNACVDERTKRRTRNYWRVALAVFAIAFIAAFVAAWKYLEVGPTATTQSQVIGSLFLAALAGGVILLFALIISTKVCSSQFVAVQLAVKDKEKELMAAGYTGFWDNPPKHLTLR